MSSKLINDLDLMSTDHKGGITSLLRKILTMTRPHYADKFDLEFKKLIIKQTKNKPKHVEMRKIYEKNLD